MSAPISAAPDAAAQAAAQAPQAATLPAVPVETVFTWSGYFQAIGVMLLLLAALWGLVWLVRRYGKFNFLPQPGSLPRDALRLEAQLPLGPRKSIAVVRFLNKRVLLGVTDHQITLLTETEDGHAQDTADFKEAMEAAQRRISDG